MKKMMSWEALLIQLKYSGLTDECHSRVKFPFNFISHTQTAIGQMKKLYRIISIVKFPFVEHIWKELNVDQNAKALLFFDVLKVQLLLLWPIYSVSMKIKYENVFSFSYQTTQQIFFNRLIYLSAKVQNVSLPLSIRTGALMKYWNNWLEVWKPAM